MSKAEMTRCRNAKGKWASDTKNRQRFATDDNLLGIGVGPKEVAGQIQHEKMAVKFFVRRKQAEAALAKGERLPKKVEQATTDVVQMAPLRARAMFTQRLRPSPGGCSGCVVVPGLTYTGTLGLGVRGYGSLADRSFILSNNHVLANMNRSRIGDAVIQPGTLDGGDPASDVIGELYDFVPLKFGDPASPDPPVNKADAACALVHRYGDFSREIFWVGYPKGWRTRDSVQDAVADGNDRVQKNGRTTGYTQGVISALSFDGWVGYDGQAAYFEDQLLISPGTFSDAGDSGSAILDMDENLVGLLFAGSATHTIANLIEDVWMRLSPIDFSDGIV